jgi:hypothetical protein
VNNLRIPASKIEQLAEKTEFFRVALFRSQVFHRVKNAWNAYWEREEQTSPSLFTPIRRRGFLKNYFFFIRRCEQPPAFARLLEWRSRFAGDV